MNKTKNHMAMRKRQTTITLRWTVIEIETFKLPMRILRDHSTGLRDDKNEWSAIKWILHVLKSVCERMRLELTPRIRIPQWKRRFLKIQRESFFITEILQSIHKDIQSMTKMSNFSIAELASIQGILPRETSKGHFQIRIRLLQWKTFWSYKSLRVKKSKNKKDGKLKEKNIFFV